MGDVSMGWCLELVREGWEGDGRYDDVVIRGGEEVLSEVLRCGERG